jgi:hypothetical protein
MIGGRGASATSVRPEDEGSMAARMMMVFPYWLVVWGASSGEFWAFPCFDAPPGTILHDADTNALAGKMHRLQREVAEGQLLDPPSRHAQYDNFVRSLGAAHNEENVMHEDNKQAMTTLARPDVVDVRVGPAFSFLWLEITGRCGLGCSHCYAGSGPSGSHGAMTAGDWRSVISQAADLGVSMVQFIGGEPTLHPDFAAARAACGTSWTPYAPTGSATATCRCGERVPPSSQAAPAT